jgi:hypothetical protein
VRDHRVARIGVVGGVAGQPDVDEQPLPQRLDGVDPLGEPVERAHPALHVGTGLDGRRDQQRAAVERGWPVPADELDELLDGLHQPMIAPKSLFAPFRGRKQ